jgi:hypothetical protein
LDLISGGRVEDSSSLKPVDTSLKNGKRSRAGSVASLAPSPNLSKAASAAAAGAGSAVTAASANNFFQKRAINPYRSTSNIQQKSTDNTLTQLTQVDEVTEVKSFHDSNDSPVPVPFEDTSSEVNDTQNVSDPIQAENFESSPPEQTTMVEEILIVSPAPVENNETVTYLEETRPDEPDEGGEDTDEPELQLYTKGDDSDDNEFDGGEVETVDLDKGSTRVVELAEEITGSTSAISAAENEKGVIEDESDEAKVDGGDNKVKPGEDVTDEADVVEDKRGEDNNDADDKQQKQDNADEVGVVKEESEEGNIETEDKHLKQEDKTDEAGVVEDESEEVNIDADDKQLKQADKTDEVGVVEEESEEGNIDTEDKQLKQEDKTDEVGVVEDESEEVNIDADDKQLKQEEDKTDEVGVVEEESEEGNIDAEDKQLEQEKDKTSQEKKNDESIELNLMEIQNEQTSSQSDTHESSSSTLYIKESISETPPQIQFAI